MRRGCNPYRKPFQSQKHFCLSARRAVFLLFDICRSIAAKCFGRAFLLCARFDPLSLSLFGAIRSLLPKRCAECTSAPDRDIFGKVVFRFSRCRRRTSLRLALRISDRRLRFGKRRQGRSNCKRRSRAVIALLHGMQSFLLHFGDRFFAIPKHSVWHFTLFFAIVLRLFLCAILFFQAHF